MRSPQSRKFTNGQEEKEKQKMKQNLCRGGWEKKVVHINPRFNDGSLEEPDDENIT